MAATLASNSIEPNQSQQAPDLDLGFGPWRIQHPLRLLPFWVLYSPYQRQSQDLGKPVRHFVGLAVSFASFSLVSTSLSRARCPSQMSEVAKMSSIKFTTSVRPCRSLHIIRVKTAGALTKPQGITFRWQSPFGAQSLCSLLVGFLGYVDRHVLLLEASL